jgi:hypothetical protein
MHLEVSGFGASRPGAALTRAALALQAHGPNKDRLARVGGHNLPPPPPFSPSY